MYLSGLSVTQFLPYESASLTLPKTGLVFIAGPNNAGKSAFLAAFDVAAGRGTSRNWRLAGSDSPARVEASFTLTETERKAIIDNAPQSEHQAAWIASEAFTKLQLTFAETENWMNATAVALAGHDGGMRPVARREFPAPQSFINYQIEPRRTAESTPGGSRLGDQADEVWVRWRGR
jgi:predicted ATPase